MEKFVLNKKRTKIPKLEFKAVRSITANYKFSAKLFKHT